MIQKLGQAEFFTELFNWKTNRLRGKSSEPVMNRHATPESLVVGGTIRLPFWYAYASNWLRQHYASNVLNPCRLYIRVQGIEMYQLKNEALKSSVLASLSFHF